MAAGGPGALSLECWQRAAGSKAGVTGRPAWPLPLCCHSHTGPGPGPHWSRVALVYVDPSSRLCPQAWSDSPAVEPAGQSCRREALQSRAGRLLQNVMDCRPPNETATSAWRHDQLAAARCRPARVQLTLGVQVYTTLGALLSAHPPSARNKTRYANKSAGFTLSLIFLLWCRGRECRLGRAEQDRCC